MQEYGISKSTASNAIALLSDIGFVRILDKKGIVRRKGETLPPVRLDEKKIIDHIIIDVYKRQVFFFCFVRNNFFLLLLFCCGFDVMRLII